MPTARDLRASVAERVCRALQRRVSGRRPDRHIGGEADTYLRRWWLIPKNRFVGVYLHQFLRSDDDRALHDHPWWNVSVLLRGSYFEHTPRGAFHRTAGHFYARSATAAHRVQLIHGADGREREVWTLFITGPRVREWGFLCPKGWRPWREFTSGPHGETIGKGCDD